MMTPPGRPLIPSDFDALEQRWIDCQTAEMQQLRRVSSLEGAALVGRNGRGDFSGIAIGNEWPGSGFFREFRVRRDHPEIENGQPRMKYVGPPGRGSQVFFARGTNPEWLDDARLRLIITEGEFKAIALARLALHERQPGEPRFLAAGIPGCSNWRGTIGKSTAADGTRVDVKGPIPDLSRIVWDDRDVLIVFDADLEDNDSVRWARFGLSKELRSRGAIVSWFDWPADRPAHAKGVDDLLAAIGPERVLALIERAFERTTGEPDLIPCHFADTGNAERIVVHRGANLRYCFAFRKWLVWDGRRWVPDETGQALKLAALTMVEFLHQAISAGNKDATTFARASLGYGALKNALAIAQSELPITPAELDRDRHLLNFTNGTVNLRTGELRPHRRSDFITKIVHFAYNPKALCHRWLQFLGEIMGASPDANDAQLKRADELIDFLHPALGYSITGETNEKAVFVPHGAGDNGKTSLLSVVRDIMPNYSATVGLDLLTSREENNNVSAARAKLLGARFVTSSETEEGQRLSAARLKRICQGPGGRVEATRKYENPIDFVETHKLWIDANHKPELSVTDTAAWNRLRLIPFDVTIPKDQQDRSLTVKLLAEGEGILAWLVAGAKRWYAEGLPNSEIVAAATNDWRKELDRLSEYLAERTVRDLDNPEAYLLNKDLYASYKTWAENNGERFLSQPKFTNQMETLKYTRKREEAGYVWQGIRFNRL